MKYKITAPDGKQIIVNAPSGASEQDALAYAQQNYKADAADKPKAPTLKEKRQSVGSGMTLRPFGLDTGIELPQPAAEGLAGMGRRFAEIGTLGFHKPAEEAKKLLDDSGYATAGGAVADLATILAGGQLLKGAGAIPKVGKALQATGQAVSAPKTIGQAVAGGAGYGAATSSDRVSGGMGGGLGGGIGYGVPKAIGAAIKPALRAGADDMLKAGVKLTPGEMLGGTAQRFEDAATSVPVLGDAIKSAKARSLSTFSRSMIDDALKPIGAKLDDSVPAGRDAIAKADAIISDGYDDVLKSMSVKVDQQYAADMAKLFDMAKKLPPKQAKKFTQLINDEVYQALDNPNQTLLGETFKEVDSSLRNQYKRFLRSSEPFNQDLGDALRTAHLHLMNMAKRQNPEAATKLGGLDQSYAKLMRVVDAAGYSGAKEGVFTPSHLLAATKKATSKKNYAKGKGFNQKVLEEAKDTMAQTIPDSGTTTRALFNTGLLGGAYMLDPKLMAAILGTSAMYTKPGQAVMTPLLASRPAAALPISQAVKASAPYSSLAGVLSGVNLSQ